MVCRNRSKGRKPLIRLPSIRCQPSKPVCRIRRSRRIRHEIRRTGSTHMPDAQAYRALYYPSSAEKIGQFSLPA
ncbi:hypothetical protein E0K94_21880, partial [Escherichia coli]